MNTKRIVLLLILVGGLGLIATIVPQVSAKKSVTFNQEIAPLFNRHCSECHRPGEAAPFSTLSYKDVRPWAKSIREKVVNRTMPPWHADPATGAWANDRRLTQEEIETVVAWVNDGAPEGEGAPPAVPMYANGWRIGKPDIVLTMPKPYTLQPGAADRVEHFKIPTNFKEDVYVRLAEARPGNRRIVHHLIAKVEPKDNPVANVLSGGLTALLTPFLSGKYIFFEKDGLSKVKPNAPVFDDGCGQRNGGGGVTKDGSDQVNEEFGGTDLCVYAPGTEAEILPPDGYKKIPAGATIWLEAHYSNVFGNESVQTDQSSIGLIVVKERQKFQREIRTGALLNTYFKIPAGAENHRVTACWTTPSDMTLLALMPHMHLRGKAMQYSARYPDGRTEILLNVPRWDFNWQTRYQFKTPLTIPKGTQLTLTAWYDNSSRNRFNPDATRAIRWGDATSDEMMLGYFEYFAAKTVDSK